MTRDGFATDLTLRVRAFGLHLQSSTSPKIRRRPNSFDCDDLLIVPGGGDIPFTDTQQKPAGACVRYAVVDNSTLTAVQRLLGEIEVANTVSLDGDIAAFETLVQAILFYDNVFYIDDYKEEVRQSRRKAFEYITPIGIETFPYHNFAAAAAASVDDVILAVQGGKVTPNDIGRFLDLLKMHTTFTWDMRSSDWFLTMKMLEGTGGIDVEKYSALNEMIFLELSANRDTEYRQPRREY